MANIVDLLGSATVISQRNPSMSRAYMLYQLFNLASSIIAPSTVILMIAGRDCLVIILLCYVMIKGNPSINCSGDSKLVLMNE